MPDPAPPMLDHGGGDIVFPDVNYPLAVNLLVLAAFAWILFGPIFTYRSVRRGRTVQGIAVYLLGLVAAIAVMMMVVWGGPNFDTPAHRFSVLWQHMASGLLYLGLGLALAAVVVGWVLRRRRVSRLGGENGPFRQG